MNEQYRCGDHEALIAYVYGEDEAADRQDMNAHVAQCAVCADEVESLRSTRRALGAWAPPETALGFRITRVPDGAAAAVLRPPAWWRQPLPAWAQAAAAVMIFAAGLTIGGRQQPLGEAPAPRGTTAVVPAPVTATTAAAISRDEIARLEQRLRTVETAQPRAPRVVAASTVDEAALLERMAAMIEASEQRQRAENARVVAAVDAVAQNIALQRRADLERVERRIGQVYSPAEEMLRQHNDALSMLVSFPQRGNTR